MVTLLVLLEGTGNEALALVVLAFHAVDLDVIALFTGVCHLVNDVLESGDKALRAGDVLRAVGVNHDELNVVLAVRLLVVNGYLGVVVGSDDEVARALEVGVLSGFVELYGVGQVLELDFLASGEFLGRISDFSFVSGHFDYLLLILFVDWLLVVGGVLLGDDFGVLEELLNAHATQLGDFLAADELADLEILGLDELLGCLDNLVLGLKVTGEVDVLVHGFGVDGVKSEDGGAGGGKGAGNLRCFHVVFLSGCVFREVCLISTEVTGFGRQPQRAGLFRQSTEKVKIGWVNYHKGEH